MRVKDFIRVGFLLEQGHFWHYVGSSEAGYRKPITSDEVRGHGPMSAFYDDGGEGDSPSFLYLVSAGLGLNEPLVPTQGGWGSLFKPMDKTFPNGYYSTCGVDKSHLTRWVEDAKHSFENRLNYSLMNPDEVNHEPVPIVNGHGNDEISVLESKPGAIIQLDASGSYDPDKDQISYNWYFYPQASTIKDIPVIEDYSVEKLKIQIPGNINSGSLHLILEVTDAGTPSLKSYKRFIIKL